MLDGIYLRPKHIIVVGGGSGIGKAIAQHLLDAGAETIFVASRNLQKITHSCKEFVVKDNQHVYPLQFDITDVNSHGALVKHANALLDKAKVDGLVISSGLNFDGSNWKGFNISESDWDKVMNTNLKGPFFLIRNFANYLYENHVKGNICVVSSVSAHRDMLSIYQVTKHSLSRIVNAYGKHLCERGVVLNAVEPGPTYTDMMKWLGKYTDGVRAGEPWPDSSIRRLIRPEEVAKVVIFLMSNLGETMSGDCIVVGGGTKSIFPC